jgi:hypothetical protein
VVENTAGRGHAIFFFFLDAFCSNRMSCFACVRCLYSRIIQVLTLAGKGKEHSKAFCAIAAGPDMVWKRDGNECACSVFESLQLVHH